MSLDISLILTGTTGAEVEVFEWNITHNLNTMADAAGIYKAMWSPEEIGATKAADITPLLADGLTLLESDPAKFEALNPENGWGCYEGLVECVKAYLKACREWPEATIYAWR